MHKHTKKQNQGFTIIELLVVIAIVGVLSSITLVTVSSAKTKTSNTTKAETIRQYQVALEEFYQDHGGYPESSNYYYVCIGLPSTEPCFRSWDTNSQTFHQWYGDDNLLNGTLNNYFKGTPLSVTESLPATTFGTPATVGDYRGILYINGGSPNCTNMLCNSYSLFWYEKGIKQDCSPGYRIRCGTDVNQWYPYGITQCGINVPAQPGDADAYWC